MFCRGWLTSLIRVSSTSCITNAWVLLAEVTIMEGIMREINLLCLHISLDSKRISSATIISSCLGYPLHSLVFWWVQKNVESSLELQPHFCGETMVKVIMGRFSRSSLLLHVWVLSVGEAPSDYLLELILPHHPLEQQPSPLSAAYEQVCWEMSVLEVCSSNSPDRKCRVHCRKVFHT